MHLAFIDIAADYAADRPDQDKPLGGTNSAVCFLARALVAHGIECTLFNKIRKPTEALGIRALPLERLMDEASKKDYSAFIFCGRWVDWLVEMVRQATNVPLVAWMHESTFNSALVPAHPAFDGIAFVSEWQRRINQAYVLPSWKQAVLRNAMNPKAATVFGEGEAILGSKTKPPVFLYAGATPRGAFHIPPILDNLRPLVGDFEAEIFCDCAPSADAAANEAYIAWMRGLPNVRHVGMVGQLELLKHMKRASFFLSPNPWPETSCIALIEAMASGLSVITTTRAVLPETAAGFARHVPISDADDPIRFDMDLSHSLFAAEVRHAVVEYFADAGATESKLRSQVAWFQDHYQWSQRVDPWVTFLGQLGARR